MRILLTLAALLLLGTALEAVAKDEVFDSILERQKGMLTPMQMPDGTKRWRFVRQPTQTDTETVVTELIAQALARAQWCPAGWEEVKRTTAAGLMVIEGRCK